MVEPGCGHKRANSGAAKKMSKKARQEEAAAAAALQARSHINTNLKKTLKDILIVLPQMRADMMSKSKVIGKMQLRCVAEPTGIYEGITDPDELIEYAENALEKVKQAPANRSGNSCVLDMQRCVVCKGVQQNKIVYETMVNMYDLQRTHKGIFCCCHLDAGFRIECSVCLEMYSSRNAIITECGHVFCRRCANLSLGMNPKCPNCHSDANPKKLLRIFL